jgi:hypothetical protein
VDEKEKRNLGFIICGPETGDGGNRCIRLSPDGPVEIGTLAPFSGFANTPEGARIIEGKVAGPVIKVTSMSEPIGKPSKVTSDEYRSGWDTIWGKREVGQA